MTLPRKHIWGWWAFDWANQPYNTLLLTFIFAPYFASAVAPDPVTGAGPLGLDAGRVWPCDRVGSPP